MNASLFNSVYIKLSVIVVSVTLAAAGIFGGGLLHFLERAEYEDEVHRLAESSHHISGMLKIDHELMVLAVQRNFDLFESMLGAPPHSEPGKTVRAGGEILPLLYAGQQPIVPGFAAIKMFTKGSRDLQATVFVRRGDDFFRLATSITEADGRSAVGTRLDRDHPAYARLLAGQAYVGVVQLFGCYFMTRYQPVIDGSGQVIGALFAGLDMSPSFSRIANEVNTIHLRESGYAFVLDARPGRQFGTFLVHPLYKGKRVSEIDDERVKAFFSKLLQEQGGEGKGAQRIFEPASGSEEDMVSVMRFPEWDWVTGVGTPYSNLVAHRMQLQHAVIALIAVVMLSIIIALKISINRLVLRPLVAINKNLRTSQERFRGLVESSDDLIYTTDAEACLTGVFGKGWHARRLHAENMIGRPIAELLGGADPQHESAHKRALAGEHVIYEWRTSGSVEEDFQSSLSPMRDADGHVCGLVAIGRDITERRRSEELVRHQAQHDALTGLPNRVLMQDRLQQAILQASRNCRDVGVLFVDLDYFKMVNDRYGHDTGDELLKAVAQRLLDCVRQSDTVARIGGDEFVVVIGDAADQAALAQVADKILNAFKKPFVLSSCTLSMSPSIGISSYPADASDAATLVKLADGAMYEAKMAGRATRCFS